MGCDKLVCANCCIEWLNNSEEASCPICIDDHLNASEIQPPSSVILEILANLRVHCTTCNRQATASKFDLHLGSNCSTNFLHTTPTVEDILSQSPTTPTLPVEKKVAEILVRRLLAESDSNTVTIPTRGQLNTCTHAYYDTQTEPITTYF